MTPSEPGDPVSASLRPSPTQACGTAAVIPPSDAAKVAPRPPDAPCAAVMSTAKAVSAALDALAAPASQPAQSPG